MKILKMISVALLVLVVLSSCEHRILRDLNDLHYIRVYFDEQIKNVTCGIYNDSYEKPTYERPVVLRVILADPQSGEIVSERYIRNQGEDSRGYYLEGYIGAPAGTYNLMVHNVGSSVTLLRNEDNYHKMYAFTNTISENHMQYLPSINNVKGAQRVAYEPEHFFHDICERIDIPIAQEVDTIRNHNGDFFTAHSIALSYYLQVRIKGIEWVRSAVATLSGMGGSTLMSGHRALLESDPVSLFFTMNYTDKKRSQSEEGSSAVLYTTFTTFGKLPDIKSVYTLNFDFIKSDGTSHVETFDITEMFYTPTVKDKQWIFLENEIVITKPEQTGGVAPDVEGWKDIEAEIEI